MSRPVRTPRAPALAGLVAALLSVPLLCERAYGWGSLGHRIAAETAALLVQDQRAELGALLARHRFELGMYAFYPDMVFRHHDGSDGGRCEGPTHFLSLDAVKALKGWPPREATADYSLWADALAEHEANAKLASQALGRLPWRAAQLAKLARGEWSKVSRVEGGYQRGDTAKGDSAAVFAALFYMGVLAHYTADAAVPHHATLDNNSHRNGQGGLHFYFEGDCVNALEPGLAERVLQRARRLAKGAPAARPISLAILDTLGESFNAITELERLDRLHALVGRPLPAGDPRFAPRRPAALGCAGLAALVEERLAAAALLTAEQWLALVPDRGVDWSKSATLQFNDARMDLFIPWP